MILYLDTSSLVKLYWEERYSDLVWGWLDEADAIATSRVTYPEAMSALARRRAAGDLDVEAFDRALETLEQDWEALTVLEVDERAAGRLALAHCIRGFDAIHLAAAMRLRETLAEEELYFSAFDSRLLGAARREGLWILGPEKPAELIMEAPAPYGSPPA